MGISGSLKKPRPWIYLANILVPYFSSDLGLNKLLGYTPGNFFGGGFFGALDIVSTFSNRVRNSKYNRLVKVLGTLGYGFSSIANLIDISSSFIPGGSPGDFKNIVQFGFDLSMFQLLLRDTLENYNTNSFVSDIKDFAKDISSLFGGLGSGKKVGSKRSKASDFYEFKDDKD